MRSAHPLVTESVKKKYAGSSDQYLWDRLNSADFSDQATLFASTFAPVFHPGGIGGNALVGRRCGHVR